MVIIKDEPSEFGNKDLNEIPAYLVEVHITYTTGRKAYKVDFSTIIDDTVRSHGVLWGSDKDYDIAYYRWENDTLISLRLYNQKTKEEESFKAWGIIGGSGLIIPD